MFFWLHLKFDDIQKWYVGGYLENRWMSYFIGLYHLMYRFFLFITNIKHWLIIYNRRKQKRSWSRIVFSAYFQSSNTRGIWYIPINRRTHTWHHIHSCYSIKKSFFDRCGRQISLSWMCMYCWYSALYPFIYFMLMFSTLYQPFILSH